MRLAFSVKQKIRIASLLFAVMACSILIRFLEDKSVSDMNESFVSMYNDRLIPATDLFYIAENASAKKSLLEDILYIRGTKYGFSDDAVVKINHFNKEIERLLLKYKKTLLVTEEESKLKALESSVVANTMIENALLMRLKSQDFIAARSLYENTGKNSASQFNTKLSELMAIQRQVGAELIKDSAYMVSGNKLYSSLQIALAVAIGFLIVGIIFTSNVVKISNDKYNLN